MVGRVTGAAVSVPLQKRACISCQCQRREHLGFLISLSRCKTKGKKQ